MGLTWEHIKICAKEGMKLEHVGIFWDIQNCNVPRTVSAENVSGNIREVLSSEVGIKSIKIFNAYGDCNALSKQVRKGLHLTGVKVVDVPHVKDGAADRAILSDMHFFAFDNLPSATLVLISGDVDFAETLHKLEQRGHAIILFVPSGVGVSSALRKAAKFVFDWPSAACGKVIWSGSPSMPRELKNTTMSPISNAWANVRPFYPQSYDMLNSYGMYKRYIDQYDVAFWDHSAGTSTSGRYDNDSTGSPTWSQHNDSADSASPSAWEQCDALGKGNKCIKL